MEQPITSLDDPEAHPARALNLAIQRAQEVLRAFAFSAREHIAIDSTSTLHYKRGNKGWGLYVQTGDVVVELLDAGLHLRISAVRVIPDLVLALKAAQRQQLHAICTNTVFLNAYLDSLEQEL